MTSNKNFMKNKNPNNQYYDDEYEDDDFHKTGKKKYSPRKRPVRNWRKEWGSINSEDDVEDFNKRMR